MDADEQIRRFGATTLVVAPGSQQDVHRFTDALPLPFTALAGQDEALHQAAGFERVWLGLLQQSGTLVVDQDQRLRYLHRANNPQASLNLPALLDALTKLQEPPGS